VLGNVSDRIRAVIELKVPDRRRVQVLEDESGIAADTWRKFLSGKQNATVAILEATCKKWPEFAFWIATGITDSNYGHEAPPDAYDGNVNTPRSDRPAAKMYFRFKLAMLDGRSPDQEMKIDELLPKPHEGSHTTLRMSFEGQGGPTVEEHDAYEKADAAGKLRMEIEHFRTTYERMKEATDIYLRRKIHT
jgi:hypothetical protein